MSQEEIIRSVCEAFSVPGTVTEITYIPNGHLHNTYKVTLRQENGDERSLVLQEINTYAFRKPVEVMENIDRVTRHIQKKKPGDSSLKFGRTEDGKPYYIADEEHGGGFWRMYNYIDSVTFNTCTDLPVVRRTGEAFGSFLNMLADFEAEKLYYSIPDFHNTPARYEQLQAAVREDAGGRVKTAETEIRELLEDRDRICRLTELYNEGKLPVRVTHNDTKINNVLFDRETMEPLAVIDLDTVMPGLAGHDFGDAVRFVANTTVEDDKNPENAKLDMELFKAFADGYLSETADRLTDTEIGTLALSCYDITMELASRFLTDYLSGDKYFHIDYPEHNLVRTRCQMALARDMADKLDSMQEIIDGFASKYRKDKAKK